MYQALYRKWRSRTFDDVVDQNHITETLKRQVQEGRLSHAYLFTGTRGTGKTTCAKLLARAVNCEQPIDGNPCNQCPSCLGIENGSILDVMELDAASNNRVDDIRAILDDAVYTPATVKKRVYIVDEVHMLSAQAFNALLQILEEPPAHLMFILATTEVHKVPATIKSRCQQFAFKRISPIGIAGRLNYVAGEEGIPLTNEGAALLARLADGGMRDALSLLDQCACGAGEKLGEQEILDALGLAGNVETAGLMEELIRRDTGAALERIGKLYAAGKDVGSLVGELSSLTRDLLIRKTAPRGGAGLLTGGYDEGTLRGLSQALTVPRLVQVLRLLQETAADLSRSANRRVDVELCVIRLCDETLDESTQGLTARLAKLEERAAAGGFSASQVPPVGREEAGRPSEPASQSSVPDEPTADADLPPWDMEPPETPQGDREGRYSEGAMTAPGLETETPPDPVPAVRTEERENEGPVSAPAPKEKPVPRSVGAALLVGDFWPDMVRRLKGKMPMGEYSFLSNPAMVQGRLEGVELILWVQNDFIRSVLDQPGVLTLVEQEGKSLLGTDHRAKVRVGEPPAVGKAPHTTEQDRDPLDDLLALQGQFQDIITEE